MLALERHLVTTKSEPIGDGNPAIFRTRSWIHQSYIPTWRSQHLFLISTLGLATTHLISRRLYTAEDGIRFQVTSCELCGAKN